MPKLPDNFKSVLFEDDATEVLESKLLAVLKDNPILIHNAIQRLLNGDSKIVNLKVTAEFYLIVSQLCVMYYNNEGAKDDIQSI